MPDPENPYARPSAWGTMPGRPVRVGPSKAATPPAPQPAPAQPPNTIFSGSAVPMARAPQARAPAPPPEPRIAPVAALASEPTLATFAAPPPKRPPRSSGLRRRLPLFGSLAVGAAGVAAVTWVLTRPPQAEPLAPPHRPAYAAPPAAPPRIEPVPALAPAAETPMLRGRSVPRAARVAQAAPQPATAAPRAEPPPVIIDEPVTTLMAPPPQPASPPPRAAIPPPSNPDAPIATRAPYSE